MYCPLKNVGITTNYYNADQLLPRWNQSNNEQIVLEKPSPGGINWDQIEPQREPSQFGPHFWYMLHTMALNYPMSPTRFAKAKMKSFLQAIPFLLPCRECTEHAKEFMAHANTEAALQNKESLFTFLWNFHNLVNKRLGKPEMPFNEALNMYRGP